MSDKNDLKEERFLLMVSVVPFLPGGEGVVAHSLLDYGSQELRKEDRKGRGKIQLQMPTSSDLPPLARPHLYLSSLYNKIIKR